MKTLNKILGIGTLALTSLVGCTKTYNIDGKLVKYNPYHATQIVTQEENEKVKYYAPFKWNKSKATGKDVEMVVKYKMGEISPEFISSLDKRDSISINKERKKFDYYLNKIDSIESAK